jgi:hypothetical protein
VAETRADVCEKTAGFNELAPNGIDMSTATAGDNDVPNKKTRMRRGP